MGKELPNNWVETKLGEVTTSYKGKKPKVLIDEEKEGFVPYLDIKAFEHNEIRQWAEVESSKIIDEKSLAIVWDGARSGWTTKGKLGALGSTMAFINPIEVNINYLYYFLQLKFDFINTNTRGIGIPHVDPTILWDIDFPLPPLPEQNRIVEKLDVLFGHLELVKSKLDRVPVLLKNFRQAVLNQAVTGKLTEEWRVGRELEYCELDNFCENSFYGPRFSKDEYSENGYPTVRTTDMTDDGFIQISPETPRVDLVDARKIEQFKIKDGDLLITRTGSIGKMARYAGDEVAIPSAYLIRFRFIKEVMTDYIYYCLTSPLLQTEMGLSSTAITQPNLNAKKIRALKVPNITLEEQQEIVNQIESLFAKAKKIEQQYQRLKEKIDTLPQAILAKAFKGELVEQLPTDGDARELLAEIERLRKENKGAGRSKARSRKMKGGGDRMAAEPGVRYGK